MKKIVSFLLSLLLVFFALPVAAASSTTDADKVCATIVANMNNLGINKDTQVHLLSKIKNGEILDSMKSGVIPQVQEHNKGNVTETMYIFPDGSRTKLTKTLVESKISNLTNDENLTTMAIGNISPMASIVYSTYQVKAEGVFITASFWVDIQQNHDYDEAQINNAYSDYYEIISGSMTNYSFLITDQYAEPGDAATAKMQFSYTIYDPQSGAPLYTGIFRLWTDVGSTYHYEYNSGLV